MAAKDLYGKLEHILVPKDMDVLISLTLTGTNGTLKGHPTGLESLRKMFSLITKVPASEPYFLGSGT